MTKLREITINQSVNEEENKFNDLLEENSRLWNEIERLKHYETINKELVEKNKQLEDQIQIYQFEQSKSY